MERWKEVLESKRPGAVFAKAVVISITFFFVPWHLISRAGFPDYVNYVRDFSGLDIQQSVTYILTLQPLQFLTNEPLWYLVTTFLTDTTGSAEVVFTLYRLTIIFLWAVILVRRLPLVASVAFIFNTQSLDIALSGIRIGLSWAVLFFFCTYRVRFLSVACMALTPLIHTTAILPLSLMVFKRFCGSMQITRYSPYLFAVLPGIFLGLCLTVFNDLVIGAIGDRRVGDSYLRGNGNLTEPIIWLVVLLTYLRYSRRGRIWEHIVPTNLVVIAIFLGPYISWADRIWAAAIPAAGIMLWSLRPVYRREILLFCLLYSVSSYIYWTNLITFIM